MSSEALFSSVIPFAGSGYAMGFALKKVLKWILIIIGFLAGMASANRSFSLCDLPLNIATVMTGIQ